MVAPWTTVQGFSPTDQWLETLSNHSHQTYSKCGLAAVSLLNATMRRLAHLPMAGLTNEVSMVAATSPPLRNTLQSDYGDWSLCRLLAKNTIDATHPKGHVHYCKVWESYWLSSAACAPIACSADVVEASAGVTPWSCWNSTLYHPNKTLCDPALSSWLTLMDVHGKYDVQCFDDDGHIPLSVPSPRFFVTQSN